MPVIGNERFDFLCVVFGIEARRLGFCDLIRVAFDTEWCCLAPRRHISVIIFRAHFHGASVNRLFEPLGQRHFRAPAPFADNDLCWNVAPENDCDVGHDIEAFVAVLRLTHLSGFERPARMIFDKNQDGNDGPSFIPTEGPSKPGFFAKKIHLGYEANAGILACALSAA